MPDAAITAAAKLLSPEALAHERERLETEGKRLVFTNGCFDLLHVGHTRYLQQARALGDALAVAVNGDLSVKALKGPSRPINREDDRAEVLAALGCVDYVVVFPITEETRMTEVISAVRPHIYAKGGDYTPDTLDPDERAALLGAGSEIRILPLVPGKSTTGLIEKSARPS